MTKRTRPKPEKHTDREERFYVHVHHDMHNGCLYVSRRQQGPFSGIGKLTLNKFIDHAHACSAQELSVVQRWLEIEILPTVGAISVDHIPCECRLHLTGEQLKCIGIKD